jgi:hypothetical protein
VEYQGMDHLPRQTSLAILRHHPLSRNADFYSMLYDLR